MKHSIKAKKLLNTLFLSPLHISYYILYSFLPFHIPPPLLQVHPHSAHYLGPTTSVFFYKKLQFTLQLQVPLENYLQRNSSLLKCLCVSIYLLIRRLSIPRIIIIRREHTTTVSQPVLGRLGNTAITLELECKSPPHRGLHCAQCACVVALPN